MPSHSKIAIFGGDMRQVYMSEALIKKGYPIYTYHLEKPLQNEKNTELRSFESVFEECQILICPIPLANSTMPIDYLAAVFDQQLKKDHASAGDKYRLLRFRCIFATFQVPCHNSSEQ